jgi:hypothetical protein
MDYEKTITAAAQQPVGNNLWELAIAKYWQG